MIKRLINKMRLLRDDRSGAALVIVSLALPMIFGMAAFSIDLGYIYYINSRLQNAADIAALAGGTKLVAGDKTAVETQALAYVKLNVPGAWDIVDDKGKLLSGTGKAKIKITPKIQALCSKKLSDAGLPCYAAPGLANPINYLSVSLNATTPLFFASALGHQTAALTSDAIVTADGSTMPPLNVAIVLDTTASMISSRDLTTACGGVSMTKLACAKQAALGMLGTLWPVVDKVAIYTYPGMSQGTGSSPSATTAAANAAKNICTSGTPTVTDYKKDSNPANYKVVDFKDDYRDMGSPPAPGVKTSSDLVKALGGTSGCTGLQVGRDSGGGYIYTFFADSLDAAQADLAAANVALAAAGQTTRQNVIVILSDGDANAPTSMIETARNPNQCLRAMNSAAAATAAGTWVYSVAYNASTIKGTASNPSCQFDTSTVSTPQVIVTTATRTVTYSQSYSNSQKRCGSVTSTTSNTSTNQTMATSLAPAPSVTGPTRSPSTTPVCSSSNRNISYTDTTVTVTVAATTPATSTSVDRSACDTMRAMASTPDKFFSVDKVGTSGGCVSEVNPTTTDLLSIFKRVAISMMTKRRAPKSAI